MDYLLTNRQKILTHSRRLVVFVEMTGRDSRQIGGQLAEEQRLRFRRSPRCKWRETSDFRQARGSPPHRTPRFRAGMISHKGGSSTCAVMATSWESRGHLGVAEDGRPFAEGEVGRYDDPAPVLY